MAGFDNDVMYADNVDFSGGTPVTGKITSNGQLLIGSTAAPNIRVGTPTNGNNIQWTLGAGTITAAVVGPPSPTSLTNHGVVIGQGTSAVVATATGSAGQVLQSGGASADPAYSTATYPSTATGTGTILRANGTNWLATTATYPNTTTINQILYSSANNTISEITAVNSASLVTSSTGVPSLAAMTSGQLIIGNTGGTPTAAVPTSTGGNFITGAGTLKFIPANFQIGSSNIGIAYSAGTFTVQGFDGTALSSTNPGYVVIPSKGTPGRFVNIAVTANQTFTDGSSGTTDNARFGLTTGVNWANDIPFFLYGVMDDTEALVNFMISRNPCATTSPAAAGISKTGSIINVDQADFFSLDNITVSSYDSNPCVCLGSFRMQFTGATDSWTVQALGNNDGIGRYQEDVVFAVPTGINGAAAGTYIFANAGTEPVFTTNGMTYTINRFGYIRYRFNGQNASTAGVGAQVLQPIFPYNISSSNQETSQIGIYTVGATGATNGCLVNIQSSQVRATNVRSSQGGLADFTNAQIALTDSLQFNYYYRAYTATGL